MDLDKLEAQAKRAIDSPWTLYKHPPEDGGNYVVLDANGIAVCDCGLYENEDDLAEPDPSGAFIAAANPAVVLELIAGYRGEEAARHELILALAENAELRALCSEVYAFVGDTQSGCASPSLGRRLRDAAKGAL